MISFFHIKQYLFGLAPYLTFNPSSANCLYEIDVFFVLFTSSIPSKLHTYRSIHIRLFLLMYFVVEFWNKVYINTYNFSCLHCVQFSLRHFSLKIDFLKFLFENRLKRAIKRSTKPVLLLNIYYLISVLRDDILIPSLE